MHLFLGRAVVVAAGLAALAFAAAPASATYYSSKDGPALGIGASCASLMEGVPRQLELVGALSSIHDETVEAIQTGWYGGVKDVPLGIALYTAAQITAVARQPEVDRTLAAIAADCREDLRFLRSYKPDRAAVAIATMCVALLDGIARQPSQAVVDKLLAAYAEGVAQIAGLEPYSSDHVKAEAFGLVKAAQIEGHTRQPEAAGQLADAAETCKQDILDN